jgi:mRNA-degrading endonuclease RelE of RelBE toxin-antitoxin system
MARLLLTEQFMDDARTIWSPRVKKHLVRVLSMIESFPESGSRNIPASLVEEFGPTIRKCSVDPYYLIYDYDSEHDVVAVYGLVPQRTTH